MTLTKRSLVLPASPPSVKLARSWVSKILEEIGREDLVDSAQLGVSELVTNALIHSRPPLSVRVRGTVDHPRIEVVDSSPVPPQRARRGPRDRGPRRPQRHHVRPRSRPRRDDVEPLGLRPRPRRAQQVGVVRAQRRAAGARPTRARSSTSTPSWPTARAWPTSSGWTLHLLGVPALLFGELRRYHFEVRRELRLLALADPASYPVAAELTEIFVRADQERRSSTRHPAARPGDRRGRGDRRPRVPDPRHARRPRWCASATCSCEVYRAFSDEHLLALQPPQVLLDLQDWYFTEFDRQAAGEQPLRWDGPTSMPLHDVPMPRSPSSRESWSRPSAARSAPWRAAALHRGLPRHGTAFPWTTFAINVAGSGAARRCSALLPAGPRRTPWLPVCLGTGVLGGFTTMSAASVDTFVLLDGGARRPARRPTASGRWAPRSWRSGWSCGSIRSSERAYEDEEGDL